MSTKNAVLILAIVGGLILLLMSQISPRRRSEPSRTFQDANHERQLTIVVDLSGSCQELMSAGGHGYEFMLKLVDRYFRSGHATEGRLILVQVSGNDRPLLWEGSPLELRRQFSSAAALQAYLLSKADPQASHVYSGLSRALDYAQSTGGGGDNAESAFVVLSDLVDNSPDAKSGAQMMLKSLAAYSKRGGSIGFYYVDQNIVPHLRQHLSEAGIDDYFVSSEIVRSPALPSFN